MGYEIVAVNPLKLFPLLSFGLANVVSLDVRKHLIEKYKEMAQLKIDADNTYVKINGGQMLNADGRAGIFEDYQKVAEKEFERLEERWNEGKIEPALKLHLARQERRLAHFKSACRFFGCDNPHRQKRGGGNGTKGRRPSVRPLFCGVHIGLRKRLTREALTELHAASEKRVAIV